MEKICYPLNPTGSQGAPWSLVEASSSASSGDSAWLASDPMVPESGVSNSKGSNGEIPELLVGVRAELL